jgi:hypothetical protein
LNTNSRKGKIVITHQAATTMTGKAAIRFLYIRKKTKMKFQSFNKCYNLRGGFDDRCEIQNEEQLMNTGSIA